MPSKYVPVDQRRYDQLDDTMRRIMFVCRGISALESGLHPKKPQNGTYQNRFSEIRRLAEGALIDEGVDHEAHGL